MNIVKGFATINSQVNNEPSVVATLGELSGYGRTFSKDPHYYRNHAYPDVGVTVFSAKAESGESINLVEAQTDHILDIVSWANEKAKEGVITLDPQTFHDAVTQDQAMIAADLEFGDMVAGDGIILPEYMQWSYSGLTFKIWFADSAFRVEYDDFEHDVIPPIEVINDLQRPWSEIADLIITDTNSMLLSANEITKTSPSTALVPVKVEWVDRVTGNSVFMTWLVMVYGPGGNNPVSWNAALKKYILDNSDYTEAEWYDVLPELFKPTEFIIIPQWDQYSVSEEFAVNGIYRPTTRFKDMVDQTKKFSYRYEEEHIREYLTHSAHLYKSLGFLAIGNDGNRDAVYSLDEKFPEYNLVSSTSLDFNRLSKRTQDWMLLIHRMLIVAESMVDETILEDDLFRLRRMGVKFLVASYEQVNYLIVTKESYYDLWVNRNPTEDDGELF
jgi:hypothetical protein